MGGTIGKECCDAFEADCDEDQPCYKNIELDSNGCRKFPRLPPPGEHPRLLFTKEEIPALRARMKHPVVWDKLYKVFDASNKCFKRFEAAVNELSDEERMSPSESTIREFFKVDETRNTGLLGSLLLGFVKNDPELMKQVKDMVVFYSRVVFAAQEYACSNEVIEKPFNFWHTREWNVDSPWLTGGASFALLYDILFNDMNEEEQKVVRKALGATCRGRMSWGFEYSARRLQSNWGPYRSSHLIMNLAIEDEEGYEEDRVAKFENLMMQFMDFGFHPSGHPIEDAYTLNLALREGSYSLIALARRGLNLFNHPHYKKCFTEWLPFALAPGSCSIYGGSSGSFFGYPTAMIFAKYVFPKDRTIDFVYRTYISESGNQYSRLTKVQSRFPVMLFAMPSLNDELDLDQQAASLNLPMQFYCENRGKMILRSDWSSTALSFTLDARPDAFLIGHDSPSRGQFVLHALGRAWAICPEWFTFKLGTHYSTVSIDGKNQEPKAPSVRPLGICECGEGSHQASADLTYAYTYSWTTWEKEGNNPGEGWELEPHDPRDFGMTSWWLPQKLHGERRVGFEGLYQWRRKIADVELVTRSAILVRRETPFVIISDRIKVDGLEHSMSWNMAMPIDTTLDFSSESEAIIGEENGERKLLVRAVGSKGVFKLEEFEAPNRNGNMTEHKLLSFEVSAENFDFRMLLYPIDVGGSPPESEWNGADSVIINLPNGNCCTVKFDTGSNNEIQMTVI